MADFMAEGFQLAGTAVQLIDINIQPAVFIDYRKAMDGRREDCKTYHIIGRFDQQKAAPLLLV